MLLMMKKTSVYSYKIYLIFLDIFGQFYNIIILYYYLPGKVSILQNNCTKSLAPQLYPIMYNKLFENVLKLRRTSPTRYIHTLLYLYIRNRSDEMVRQQQKTDYIERYYYM